MVRLPSHMSFLYCQLMQQLSSKDEKIKQESAQLLQAELLESTLWTKLRLQNSAFFGSCLRIGHLHYK